MSDDAWLDVGENRQEWDRLVDGIGLADFFQLWPVHSVDREIESAICTRFIAEVGADSDGWQYTEISALLGDSPLDAERRSRLSTARGWLLAGGSASPEQVARAAAALNQRRDAIRSVLRGPMVMVLHPLDWKRTRAEATDLWSVHIDVIRFVAPIMPNAPEFPVRQSACLRELPRVARAPARAHVAREERRAGFGGPLLRWGGLEELVRLALAAGLVGPELRPLLMRGLPTSFVLSLRMASRPIDQLRFDLKELEAILRLKGLTVPPLAVWLENAADLAWPSELAYSFMEARARLLQGKPIEQGRPGPGVALPRRLIRTLDGLAQGEDVAETLRAWLDTTSDLGTRACIAVDLSVALVVAGRPPSTLRDALHTARSQVERLGDLRLIGRHHARAAWIHGHMGDCRSGLAEVTDGRRIVELLGLHSGDDLVIELDTVAYWLETAARGTPPG